MELASRVAVVVPSPATSLVVLATCRTSCAPRFSNLSENSTDFATVTPSLVILGGTVGLFKEDIAAAGAKSDGDGFGELVYTVEHGLTGFLTKENVFAFGGEEALGDVHYRSRSGNVLLKWV